MPDAATDLYDACEQGRVEVVERLLVTSTAVLNVTEGPAMTTPLWIASAYKATRSSGFIPSRGPLVSVAART